MEANTVLKAKHSSYQTRLDDFKNIWIQNIENLRGYSVPKNLNYKLNDYEYPATAKAYIQALGLERLRELNDNKERLSTNFILSPEGKLLEIEFITAEDTSLGIEEIETLETALKRDIVFSVSWLDDTEPDFISINTCAGYDFVFAHLQKGIKDGQEVKTKIVNVSITPPSLPDRLKKL